MRTEADLFKPKRHDLRDLIRKAFKYPYDGKSQVPSRHHITTDSLTEPGRPISLLLTYDEGTHASGWWRNSEFDRCLHLSMTHVTYSSLILPGQNQQGPQLETPEDKEVRAWAKEVFGQHTDKLWIEPAASPVSDAYRRPHVPHVRLFLNQQNLPILPKGEVYHLKPFADGSSPPKVFR